MSKSLNQIEGVHAVPHNLNWAIRKSNEVFKLYGIVLAVESSVRCVGCGCTETTLNELCRDCYASRDRELARLDEPKSWQWQLAIMENPEL